MTSDGRSIIVIDVESNGLYGQPFCVGAVLMDHGGRVLESFVARCPIDQVVDEFVEEKVLPNIEGIEVSDKSLHDLESKFIEWFSNLIDGEGLTPHVLVDVGFPVDMGFLYRLGARSRDDVRGCIWRNVSPYPVLDLASVFMALGVDSDIDREEFARPLIGVARGKRHNPAWDAEVSGLCFIRVMRMAVGTGLSDDR